MKQGFRLFLGNAFYLMLAMGLVGPVSSYAQEESLQRQSVGNTEKTPAFESKNTQIPEELILVQQEEPESPPETSDSQIPEMVVRGAAIDTASGGPAVIGSQAAVRGIPGSGTFLATDDIRGQSYDDINRILRKVPGVYVRPEDGYGLFPNISLRGVDTSRSAKVTIMEDGVLTSPAPYSAPAAYYSPTAGRMHAIEVLKGSSQVRYGPHTSGGVINYLSTPIPEEPMVYSRMFYGRFDEIRLHSYAGGTYETGSGRLGFLLEGYYRETDGFEQIDLAPDFRNGDNTGFSKGEPMLKLFWEPNSCVYQRWEAKLGYTDLDANETYLGLSESDFRDDPSRRYSASRFDRFQSSHVRSYIRHILGAPQDDFRLVSTAYYNKFQRNWFKLHQLRGVDDGAGGTVDMNLSRALAGDNGGRGLAVLRGQAPGTLQVRANNRSYYLMGYESVATRKFDTGRLQHEFTAGARLHYDQIHRFQKNDDFTQAANGAITAAVIRNFGTQSNRVQSVLAGSIYLEDAITLGRLTVTPGVRFEQLWMRAKDFRNGENFSGNLDMLGGGGGMTYELDDEWTLLTGIYRGFSPPSPRGVIRNGISEETTVAWEGGTRYQRCDGALGMSLIGFYTHFDDLIVIDNIGGSGSGLDQNVGEVYSGGIEFALQYDPGVANGWCIRNPYFLSLTYTDARTLTNALSADAESIFAGNFRGARVPYIPEWALSFGTGLETDGWGIDFTGFYVDRTFTTASNTFEQFEPNGVPDSRFGTTNEYFVADLSIWVQLNDHWKLFGGAQNVFGNDDYITSRHPHGPRPGLPRIGYVGLETTF